MSVKRIITSHLLDSQNEMPRAVFLAAIDNPDETGRNNIYEVIWDRYDIRTDDKRIRIAFKTDDKNSNGVTEEVLLAIVLDRLDHKLCMTQNYKYVNSIRSMCAAALKRLKMLSTLEGI